MVKRFRLYNHVYFQGPHPIDYIDIELKWWPSIHTTDFPSYILVINLRVIVLCLCLNHNPDLILWKSLIQADSVAITMDIEAEACIWGLGLTRCLKHYNDVIMATMTSQITSLTIVYSTVYSGADRRKHQSSVSLAFVQRIHRGRGKCFHLMTSSWPGWIYVIRRIKDFQMKSQMDTLWRMYSVDRYLQSTSQKSSYQSFLFLFIALFAGIISNGGEKPNIIPEETSLNYYIRVRVMSDLEILRAKFENCIESAAKATGCTVGIAHTMRDIFRDRVKQRPFYRRYFQIYLAGWKLYFCSYFNELVPKAPIKK